MAAAATPAQPPPPGIYVPVPTFFATKSSSAYDPITLPVDLDAQTAHALYLARSGIVGLVLLGSTGEAVHLREKERFEILNSVKKALDEAGFPNYPIIAGTASQNVEDVVSQLIDAERAGAQWGLVLAPGYFAGCSCQEGLVRWFRAVADRSPLPIMIYHYPAVSNNVKFLPETYATLAAHPNIVGCKLSHGDVSVHCQVASHPRIDHDRFRAYTGLGQQLLPVVSVGFAGAIDGSAGFFPRTMVRLYGLSSRDGALTPEERSERRTLQYKVSCMEELVVKFGTVGIKEAVARLRGFGDVDGTRLPLWGGMGEGEWERWGEMVEAMQVEERRLGGENEEEEKKQNGVGEGKKSVVDEVRGAVEDISKLTV